MNILYLLPLPSMIRVSSLVITIFLHDPNISAGSVFSKVTPISSEMTVAPVAIARSYKTFFLLSPKPWIVNLC